MGKDCNRKKYTVELDEKHILAINQFYIQPACDIFSEEKYFKLHSNNPSDIYAQCIKSSNGEVLITSALYFTDNGAYLSPKRGTYGGLAVHNSVDIVLVELFIKALKLHTERMGGKSICLKLAPTSHNASGISTLTNVLLRHNFFILSHELNYSLHIDEQLFKNRIQYGNKKKLTKCINSGFLFQEERSENISEVYSTIQENRNRKGYQLSMTQDQLCDMQKLFPERFKLFSVREPDKNMVIASAVCIIVNEGILYVFYWGDASGYEGHSPIAYLANGLYDYCKKLEFKILDVGTSTINGEPNYGLINFKRNLGFSESLKLTLKLNMG